MEREPMVDPLRDALADLQPWAPRQHHAYRVRRRCHTLLARHRSPRRPTRTIRTIDLIGASAIALYVVMAMTQALQLLAR